MSLSTDILQSLSTSISVSTQRKVIICERALSPCSSRGLPWRGASNRPVMRGWTDISLIRPLCNDGPVFLGPKSRCAMKDWCPWSLSRSEVEGLVTSDVCAPSTHS